MDHSMNRDQLVEIQRSVQAIRTVAALIGEARDEDIADVLHLLCLNIDESLGDINLGDPPDIN